MYGFIRHMISAFIRDIHLPTRPWTESLLLIQHYAVQLPSICLQL